MSSNWKDRLSRSAGPPPGHLLDPAPSTQLAYRLVARLRQVAIDQPTIGAAKGWVGIGALSDIQVYRHRASPSTRATIRNRMILNFVEQSAWATQSDESLDSVVLLGMPVSVEAGIRFGPWALGVPLANFAGASIARSLAGMRTPAFPFVFQALGTGTGWALFSYDAYRIQRLRAVQAAAVAADHRRCSIAGSQGVAMGLDNVVDLVARTAPLLTLPGERPHLSPIHVWKAQLAAAARGEAAYLGDALRRWEQGHNTTSPILAHDVQVFTEDGDMLLILPAQEAELVGQLDALKLRGSVTVSAAESAAHHPGRAVNLRVTGNGGTARVALTAVEGTQLVQTLNPAPFAPALMIAWLGLHAHATGENVPVNRVVPGVGLAAAATAWTVRNAARDDPNTARDAVLACVATALAHTIVATPNVRNAATRDGLQPHPFTSAIWAPLFLLGVMEAQLAPQVRRLAWLGLGATATAGLALYPRRIQIRDVLLGLQLSAVASVSVRNWGRALRAHAGDLQTTYEAEQDQRADEAFLEGAAEVLQVVESAVADLERRLPEVSDRLPPTITREAAIRLLELRARLNNLAPNTSQGPSGCPLASE